MNKKNTNFMVETIKDIPRKRQARGVRDFQNGGRNHLH